MESAMVPSQSNKYAPNEPAGNFSLLVRDDSLFIVLAIPGKYTMPQPRLECKDTYHY